MLLAKALRIDAVFIVKEEECEENFDQALVMEQSGRLRVKGEQRQVKEETEKVRSVGEKRYRTPDRED